MRSVLYTDGGARGNPGPAGIGVVLQDGEGRVVAEIDEGLGHATNNVAEYRALIAGLELALEHGATELEVRVDSKLVAMQVKGRWKIKSDSLRPLAVEARALLNRFEQVSITQVPRRENTRADRLANIGMDSSSDAEPSIAPHQSRLL
ncbi:MAG TPA: ribonuclease HI family protein [Actinomycetota bacterium]|nr:ribonuclease HI family protein [Actinomycetota bacterium]